MSPKSDRLEHLFSRQLDGEATPQQRELLDELIANDGGLRRDFEDYRDLDSQVGNALRTALGQTHRTAPRPGVWTRIGRGLALAAAACVAMLIWLHPSQPAAQRGDGRRPQAAASASWFAPLAPAADSIEPPRSSFERPELRLRGTQRNWIVIPGDQPGSYMVIEVDRVRTHVIGVHRDF